jgi:AP-1 complex subunit gamma-1
MGKPDKNSPLKDFVLKIRQSKTKAEERAVVNTESAYIRETLRNLKTTHRNRAIAKLMFIGMLGYPTQFGNIDSLQLLTSNDYAEKRIAYLSLSQLLDESNELLLLATCSIKRDLEADSSLVIGLALSAVANISTADMTRYVLTEVVNLLRHKRSFVRRKAALAGCRIVRMAPECAEDFLSAAPELLEDQNPSAQNAGTYLVHEMLKASPELMPELARLVPLLCRTLDSLSSIKETTSDYTFHEVNNPFLMVSSLKLLRALSALSGPYRQEQEETLSRLSTNLIAVSKSSYAVFYEFVLLILRGDFSPALKSIAINTTSKMLSSKESNYRYTGLRCLQESVQLRPMSFQQYKYSILECLDEADDSVRLKALEIISLSVTEENAQELYGQLFMRFKRGEQDYRRQVGGKICSILETFQSQREWFINSFIELLEEDSTVIPESLVYAATVALQSTLEVQQTIVRKLFKAMKAQQDNEVLQQLALWSIGEYFHLVESDEEVMQALEELADTRLCDKSREYLISALFKIALMRPNLDSRVRYLLELQSDQPNIEVQQRACEYLVLLSPDFLSLRRVLGGNGAPKEAVPDLLEVGEVESVPVMASGEEDILNLELI